MPTKSNNESRRSQTKVIELLYQEALSRWPIPYETRFVDTTFGKTHLVISGPKEAPPLVLLHGKGVNAAVWLYNVAILARQFRVYAIDIIGDIGKSANTNPTYQSGDHARWLVEVFDTFNLNCVALCGASVGGWLAHSFALQFPQRVNQLILLAPAGFYRMRTWFMFRATLTALLPASWAMRSLQRYMSSPQGQRLPKWAMDSLVALYKIQRGNPIAALIKGLINLYKGSQVNSNSIPTFSDEELLSLSTRTLLVLGEDEVIYNVMQTVRRVRSVAPSIKVIVIPKAGHSLAVDQPELVSEEILRFCY